MGMSISFPLHSLSIRYEPSEGSMMVDISTIQSLELIQNLHNPKSRDCLFGLLNNAHTAMGSRLLRSNLLQPLTDEDTLNARYDAVEELSTREEIFFATNQGMRRRPATQNGLQTRRSFERLCRHRQGPELRKPPASVTFLKCIISH